MDNKNWEAWPEPWQYLRPPTKGDEMTRTYRPDLPDDIEYGQPDFKVGDEVYIACKPPPGKQGPWTSNMDKTVGKYGVVRIANGNNPEVKVNDPEYAHAFFYPPNSLIVIKRNGYRTPESDSDNAHFAVREAQGKTLAPGSSCIVRIRRLVNGELSDKHEYLYALKCWVANKSWVVLGHSATPANESVAWIEDAYEYTDTRLKLKSVYGTRDELPEWKAAVERFKQRATSGLQLKHGGKYRLRNNQEVFVEEGTPLDGGTRIFYAHRFGYYEANGKYRSHGEHEFDIMAEIVDDNITTASTTSQITDLGTIVSYDSLADSFRYITLIPEQETNAMSSLNPITVETRTFVNGVDAKQLSDDSIFAKIAEAEAEIERLNKIKRKPKALQARINALTAGIDALVALSDARQDAAAAAATAA